MFVLDKATGGVEGAGPHIVEEPAELGEARRAGTVQPTGAVPSLGEKARLLEDGEVLADRWAGDVEGRGNLARGKLFMGDESQDGPPSRFSQGPEGVVGVVALGHGLAMCLRVPGRHAQRPTGLPSGSAKMAIRP